MATFREKVDHILKMYPDAECALHYTTPFELLIATVLSAQTTDRQVNIVTDQLFREANTPEDFISLGEKELAQRIRSIGFFNTKAKNIIALCHMLLEEQDGTVPDTREELIRLPGVGRKTANVVLSNAFAIPAFAVDTHVMRTTQRLGMTKYSTPEEIEKDITKKIPKKFYCPLHHALIQHGRTVCRAINPNCLGCELHRDCPEGKKRYPIVGKE